ncbi:MAG: hypothetical protein H0U16_02630, partial [Actinobacteria bacterium]|nr:hypothetical protein [Actinomycetota bacterium]
SHPVLRRLLGSDADVSSAIRFAIRHRRHERFVPRWYYLLWLGRVVAPSLYRATGRVLPKPLPHRRGGPVA